MDRDTVRHLDDHAAVGVGGFQHQHGGLCLSQRQSDGRSEPGHVPQACQDFIGLLGDSETERQSHVALADPGVSQGMVDEQSDRDEPRRTLRADRRPLPIVEPADQLAQSVVAFEELSDSLGGCFGWHGVDHRRWRRLRIETFEHPRGRAGQTGGDRAVKEAVHAVQVGSNVCTVQFSQRVGARQLPCR